MPRYSSPQRDSSGPQNDLIEKEAQADSLNKSMPDLLSMGNEALQAMLGGGPLVIPLRNSNESMSNESMSDESMSMVIGSDQEDEKISENDQSQNQDDLNMSVVSTSKARKQRELEEMEKRMQDPDISLVDSEGHEEEIKSEAEVPKKVKEAEEKAGNKEKIGSEPEVPEAVEKAEDHAENPGEGQPGELGQAEKDMDSIKELDLAPVRMKENKLNMEVGFKSTFTQLLGVTVGKILGTIFNLGLLPFTGGIIAKDFIKSWWKRGSLQKKRTHKIPGWDGDKFEKNQPQNVDEVNVDFRKVPAVWSYPIASKAAEPNPEGDQNDPRQREKPLDPIVSVMVAQPKEGSADTFYDKEMGHTFLGIEYSRFSKISNRYERYRIKYGFYPAGGTVTGSGTMMMLSRDAVLPGQLANDDDHYYTIARRFRAKPAQVNAIFRASETYADKGYGYYTRNCTTFVKDMVQNVGKITKLAPAIFQQDAVQFGLRENVGMFGAKAFHLNAKAGTENMLINLGDRTDLNYENFGEKRATQRDFRNYQKSLDHDITIQKYTEIPAMVGENLRRASGEHAGVIDSWENTGPLKKNPNGPGVIIGLPALLDAYDKESGKLKELVVGVLKGTDAGQLPKEVHEIITYINVTGYSLYDLEDKTKKYCKDNNIERYPGIEMEALDADDLRKGREGLDKDIARLQTLLRIFKNDERLHLPIVHLISLVNWGNKLLDGWYRNLRRGKDNPGELGDIRGEMRHETFTVLVGDKEAEFSPTEYEAYLQVYKTPEAAVKNKARCDEIFNKADSGAELTKAEEGELKKFQRMEATIRDFKAAHNYMVEKDTFSQQDVDYAFRLQAKERQDDAQSEAFLEGKTSSSIYQSLFFEKVFGGMKERLKSRAEFKNIEKTDKKFMDDVQKWLDEEMSRCCEGQKFSNLVTLMTGMERAMETPTEEEMLRQFQLNMRNNWINRVFLAKAGDEEFIPAFGAARGGFFKIMANKGSKFRKRVDNIIKYILSEDIQHTYGPENPNNRL